MIPARLVQVYCQSCRQVTSHVLSARVVTCPCGVSRTVGEEFEVFRAVLAGAVVDVAYCHSCRAWLPVGHVCWIDGGPGGAG